MTSSEYPQSWNQSVLTALKSGTQCVIVHYYPGGSNTAGMLTDPSDIAGIVSTLHSELSQYAGIANPASIPILVTETNSTLDLDTQPAALFAADMDMTWLENGVTSVDWWNEHNGEGTVSTVNGATDYGDQGIFSNNTSYGGTTKPAVDTPFAPYYGIEMLSKLAAPGSTMVSSSRPARRCSKVHSVRDAAGNLNVLIDNEDPSNSYTVSLGYSGFFAVRHSHRLHPGQQRDNDHQRLRLGDVSHRRAVLADGRAHPGSAAALALPPPARPASRWRRAFRRAPRATPPGPRR